MRSRTAWARRAAFSLTLCILLSGVGNGQRTQAPSPAPVTVGPQDSIGPFNKPEGPPPSLIERQTKARNEERQKRLVSDTDKLLALATQLHEDVGKTDRNILSLDVIHRAEAIEKLAHAVKERMKS